MKTVPLSSNDAETVVEFAKYMYPGYIVLLVRYCTTF